MSIANRLLTFLFVVASMLALAGCGGSGGGDGGGSTTTPIPVTYTVEWAARTRTSGPASALSVTFTLRNSQGQTVVTDIRNRNTTPAAYTGAYTSATTVMPGQYTAGFTFHSAANAGGDVVATGSQAVTIGTNGTVPNIQVEGTIASVVVDPDQRVRVGETVDLVFSALDEDGGLLAITPGSASWTIIDGGGFLSLVQGGSAVRGTAVGNATVRVTVDGVASAPVTVEVVGQGETVTVVAPNRTILFAAAQDGDRPWEAIQVTGNQASAVISDSAGRYGLAVAIETPDGVEVRVLHATVAETDTFQIEPPLPNVTMANLSGTLTSLDAGEAVLTYGFESVNSINANGAYSVELGRRIQWDLVATLHDATDTPVGVNVRRALGELPLTGLNYDANTSFAAFEEFGLAAQGSVLDGITLFAQLTTSGGTVVPMGLESAQTTTYRSLPSNQRSTQDRYTLFGNAFGDDWSTQSTLVRSTPDNVTLTMPNLLAPVTVTTDGVGEGTRGHVEWTTLAGAKAYQIVLFGQTIYETTITAGWLGEETAHAYDSADFFDLSGWNTQWSLGQFADWRVTAFQNNGTVGDLLNSAATLRNGYAWQTSERFGSLGQTRLRAGWEQKRKQGLPGAPIRRKR